ncbi:MAG TPA: hypothetical protein VK891_18275, partial [Euzebyales bacterium]|nr:hypothetical protein [Euzebyales bacterium]
LYVWYHQFISPAIAEFLQSGIGVLMVILGGVGTLTGPLVGAAVVTWIENVVSGFIGRWPTVMGLIFIFVVLFARDGLVGGASRLWRARRGGGRDGDGDTGAGPAAAATAAAVDRTVTGTDPAVSRQRSAAPRRETQ